MVRPMEDESNAMCSHFQDPSSLNALLPDLEQALESAMAASSGGPGGPSLSPGRSYSAAGAGAGQEGRAWGRNRQRVLARLEVVRGVPFYGYHGKEELFVKASEGRIQMAEPRRALRACLGGSASSPSSRLARHGCAENEGGGR